MRGEAVKLKDLVMGGSRKTDLRSNALQVKISR